MMGFDLISYSAKIIQIKDLSATVNMWHNGDANNSTPIHFAHGNGFPSGAYQQMLTQLAKQRVVYALDHRATWVDTPSTPSKRFSWYDAADDLIACIERSAPTGVIGVGHSLGGVVTLLAAHKRPDLFKQIILIEPVAFPIRRILSMIWMPMNLRLQYIPIAKQTLRRRHVWQSREDFVAYHSKKPAFKGIDLSVMADYAEHGLRTHGNSFELSFPKAWEAHIYCTTPNVWHAISRLKIPCVIAKAENSVWVPDASWQKWQHMRPDFPLHILPGVAHMAPMQHPKNIANWILSVCDA